MMSLYFDETQLERLKAHAKGKGRAVAAVVRDAVDAYLRRYERKGGDS